MNPFLGQLMCFPFNFAPKGWAMCAGQFLAINQNQALFALLGTTFGGNGQTNYALPDLRGRTPIHTGNGVVLGQAGGEPSHTLNIPELPAHTHPVSATTNIANQGDGKGNLLGKTTGNLTIYSLLPPDTTLNPATVSSIGGNQPHENRSPYLALNWCIALQGIFPTPN